MRSALHPADRATLFILGVVTATLAAACARGVPLAGSLALHAAMLAGFSAFAWRAGAGEGALLRGIAVIAVMFTLYTTLGHIAFSAVPWRADPWLASADAALFAGRAPALRLQSIGASRWSEPLSLGYALFIPYLYLSILLSLLGRPPRERDAFVTGFAVLYALSFLGYLFLPARGPIVELAGQFSVPLRDGFFHRLVVASVQQVGGPHGAFPSLHVGASLYATLFDLRHRNPLRGMIYLPLVAVIALATLVLRYHYAVDLFAALALAFAGLAAARRWRASPAPADAGIG